MAKATINIKSQMSLDEIESLYRLFRRYKGEIDLHLPETFRETGAFGVIPALIQLIGTWVRFNNGRNIQTMIDSKSIGFKNQLEDFINGDLGFCCAALLDNPNRNISLLDKHKIKINDYLPYRNRFDLMKSDQRMKGDKMFLACFDHLGQYGLIPQFYLDSDKLNSEQDVKELLVSKILSDVLKNIPKARQPNLDLIANLTRIIYELIENTHSWGRTNYDGSKSIKPNIRGTYIKFHKIGRNNISKYINNHDGLNRYFQEYIDNNEKKDLLHFLEISIFDIGSGYASVFSRSSIGSILSIPIKDEVNLVKSCLTKNNTTANNSPYQRGLGLNNVLKTLNKGGFIRIRSGRTALYRDLITNPYQDRIESNNNVILKDWQNQNGDYYEQMDWSAGSLITFLLPLDYNSTI